MRMMNLLDASGSVNASPRHQPPGGGIKIKLLSGAGGGSSAAIAPASPGGSSAAPGPPSPTTNGNQAGVGRKPLPKSESGLGRLICQVLENPTSWWGPETVKLAFVEEFVRWVVRTHFRVANMTREVQNLSLDGGADGGGPRIPCTIRTYAKVLVAICRYLQFGSLYELANAKLTALDVGTGIGGFFSVLSTIAQVWGVEKTRGTYEVAAQVVLHRSRAFKGIKDRCRPLREADMTTTPYILPWDLRQPQIKNMDVKKSTFSGPTKPTTVHLIVALHGADLDTLLNSFHAVLLMKVLPPTGEYLYVMSCFVESQ